MIADNVLAQARKQFAANLMNRDAGLRVKIRDEQSALNAKGLSNSGRAVFHYIKAAGDELAVRAGLAWNAVVRSQRTFGVASETMADDLRFAFNDLLGDQRAILESIVLHYAPTVTANAASLVSLSSNEAALVARYANEADFVAGEFTPKSSLAAPTATTLHVQGWGNVIQIGNGSVAHVAISNSDADNIANALDALRAAIQTDASIVANERQQIVELVADALEAARGEKPNPTKLRALISGVGQAVQTLAAAQPAWMALMDAVNRIPGLMS
jgi:hypothetical protein